jgi:hypothetical protein
LQLPVLELELLDLAESWRICFDSGSSAQPSPRRPVRGTKWN